MTTTRTPFVVPGQNLQEDSKSYLQRVFKDFQDYSNFFIGTSSQGHLPVLEITSSGSYEVPIKPQHRITYLTVIASPGNYIFNINLSDNNLQDNKDGDIVQLYMKQLQAGTAPTIRVYDQTQVLLYEKIFTGTGTDSEFKQFLIYKNQWNS